MNKQNFHLGSFLIGLLAGGVALMLLALSQPLRTETQTSQLLRKQSQQIPVTTLRSVDKTWLKFRSGLSTDWQKTVRDSSHSSDRLFGQIGAGLHRLASQPCSWLAWLDREFMHFASLVGIHSRLNPPVCSA